MNDIFRVSAWHNGKSGYGFEICEVDDRDKYFARETKTVLLDLPDIDKPIEANIDKDSFWKSENPCMELIKFEIRDWLEQQGYISREKESHAESIWKNGKPPQFEMEKIPKTKNKFRIIRRAK